MKKIIITSIVLSSILLSGVVLAETSGIVTPLPSVQTRKQCMLSAMDARKAALMKANDNYKKAQETALRAKKDALSVAKKLTDKTARKDAIKVANDTYAASLKKNRDDLKMATKSAKDKYKTDVAACPK